MSRQQRKRQLTVRIKVRDSRDAKRILDSLKSIAREPQNEPVSPTPDVTPEYEGRRIADEQLETKVNKAAAKRLDEVANEAAARNQVEAVPADAPNLVPQMVIIEKRQRLRVWLRAAFDFGYQWSVDVTSSTLERIFKGGGS